MMQQDVNFVFPPGLNFNFSPTDEQILDHYLRRRIYGNNSESQFSYLIKEFDVYSTEPWNLPRDFFYYGNEETDIYFFTPRHPTSQKSKRANRSAGQGFWDGNAKAVVIKTGSEIVGHKTSLNFKLIKTGSKIKSEWIMHEYRLSKLKSNSTCGTTFDDFVLCKIHRKKSTSNKDTIKRSREEGTEDGFVEEQRMVKKSRVEEDQVCDELSQTSSNPQAQLSSLERGTDSSMSEPSTFSSIPMPEPSLQACVGDEQDDFSLSDGCEFFLAEFLGDLWGGV